MCPHTIEANHNIIVFTWAILAANCAKSTILLSTIRNTRHMKTTKKCKRQKCAIYYSKIYRFIYICQFPQAKYNASKMLISWIFFTIYINNQNGKFWSSKLNIFVLDFRFGNGILLIGKGISSDNKCLLRFVGQIANICG